MNKDQLSYARFCKWDMVSKAIATLNGIVHGIAADGKVSDSEVELLNNWLIQYDQYSRFHPFREVIEGIETIINDRIIDEDERADMEWLFDRLLDGSLPNDAKANMQELHGLAQGIVADHVISVDELRHLQQWINDHDHLKTVWPYDELEALLLEVMRDKVIDAQEHQMLLGFLNQFCELPGGADTPVVQFAISGVCAVCPEVSFEGKSFCVTGSSSQATRTQIEKQIAELGGIIKRNVVKDLDYLVIGAEGNPCWAFACYGRKVEKAMEYRKVGNRIVLVHENDFWDAIQDAGRSKFRPNA